MKKCSKCYTKKDFYEFIKGRNTKDGFSFHCRSCLRMPVPKNHQNVTKQKTPTSARKGSLRLPKGEEYFSSYYALKKDTIKERARQYYKNNSDKCRERVKLYASKNRAMMNAITAQYKATKHKATPPWLTADQKIQIRRIYEKAHRLSRGPSGEVYHVDHIVPLRGENICGLHVPWNLQILTRSQNCSKGNKLELEITH